MTTINALTLAQYIDHTLLSPTATNPMIVQLCREAMSYSFHSVCVPPCFVETARKELSGANVKICTVIGFPLGYSHPRMKEKETEQAIIDGANEIDMVISIHDIFENNWKNVENEIKKVVSVAKKSIVKVILETSFLSKEQIVQSCKVAIGSGAQFVKTSTGFSTTGATRENVQLMRTSVGESFGVKASGGIKDLQTMKTMLDAGANRIGSSSSVRIINSLQEQDL